MEDVGGVLTDEVESNGSTAPGQVGRVNGDEREAAEGDGRVGARDGADVGGDARGVGEAGGEEDSDGEPVAVTVTDEFAELDHGDDVADLWRWVQDDGVLHRCSSLALRLNGTSLESSVVLMMCCSDIDCIHFINI